MIYQLQQHGPFVIGGSWQTNWSRLNYNFYCLVTFHLPPISFPFSFPSARFSFRQILAQLTIHQKAGKNVSTYHPLSHLIVSDSLPCCQQLVLLYQLSRLPQILQRKGRTNYYKPFKCICNHKYCNNKKGRHIVHMINIARIANAVPVTLYLRVTM